jgi:hypothetical protein
MSEHYLIPYASGGAYPLPAGSGESRVCETLVNMALVGALVGGSAAAARNAARLGRDEIEFREALRSTGKTSLASGVATALAGAAAGVVTDQGLLRLSVMFGVGAAVLYGIDRWSERQEAGDA